MERVTRLELASNHPTNGKAIRGDPGCLGIKNAAQGGVRWRYRVRAEEVLATKKLRIQTDREFYWSEWNYRIPLN